jgi:hypothetical protein
MDFIVTTNLECDEFNQLKIIQTDKFSTIKSDYIKDFDFDKVYYAILKNNELSAFKMIGYSFRNNKYLIQTPNGPFWNDFERTNIFSSPQHYYDYVGGNSKPLAFDEFEIAFENAKFNDKPLFKKRTTLYGGVLTYYDVNKISYEWSNSCNKPIPSQGYIDVAFYCKNGVYINIVTKDKQYLNYANCAKNGLSNMKLVDFGNDEINININIVINTEPKKIVRTLTIIEE